MSARDNFQQRCGAWRLARFPHETPSDTFQKLVEEIGEMARAMVGEREHREGRGNTGDEAAQALLVLASLIGRHYPDRDLLGDALAELERCENAT